MTKPLTFQQIIMKLHEFWTAQGCVLWQPYNIQVGAGTGNPATMLRVLGPEPWRVAYVEPSVRPDDGRYGENPNRMQYYFQYQVILKPDPGNPQELYLQSLEAIGINPREHDIRFVEDNWESPALGAWGLGWEVWLDGQEISQFTYFQQAGGLEVNPVSVEITYGLERIAQPLQSKDSVWKIDWLQHGDTTDALTYADVLLQSEIEHCKYYFEVADVEGLRQTFEVYEHESKRALEAGLVVPSYDYVLKCSHLFNVLDARGAIGVTERASYFRRMRDMTRKVAKAYADQRQTLEHPMQHMASSWAVQNDVLMSSAQSSVPVPLGPSDFIFEIGVEELPAGDVDAALAQLRERAPKFFENLRLTHDGLDVYATPRRLTIYAKNLANRQSDLTTVAKGPSADRAFDADGKPTKAAEGFARGKGISVDALRVEDGYVVADVHEVGSVAIEVLAEQLSSLISGIKFGKSMRWNSSGVTFSRPIRWYLALFGETVIPFTYAQINSDRMTRGLRPYGSPAHEIRSAGDYQRVLENQGIILDYESRRNDIKTQVLKLAQSVNGLVLEDEALFDEVTNLVEAPKAVIGRFEEKYLQLPREVLVTVMRDKQRYFSLEDASGKLLPYFITIRNGDDQHMDKVAYGNEQVLRARFSDADYFFSQDIKKPLQDFLPRLNTLTFQEKLGSMLDKNKRIEKIVTPLGKLIGLDQGSIETAQTAASILKADLATQMVVEMTSLQGTMGREYAKRSGYSDAVAQAVFEHWLPRSAEGEVPTSEAGTLLSIADRLDSLTGLFAAGLAPQSTADPFGLRRAALGILQVLMRKNISFDIVKALDVVAEAQPLPVTDEVKTQILDFISGRMRAWAEDQVWARDVSAAVLAEQALNPAQALIGMDQLTLWVGRADWEALLDGFARCVRITRNETTQYTIDPALLVEPQEKALYEAYQSAEKVLQAEANVDGFLGAFVPMLPTVTAFFDHVLVNSPDPAVRANRLGLLQAVSAMQKGRADLSLLSGF